MLMRDYHLSNHSLLYSDQRVEEEREQQKGQHKEPHRCVRREHFKSPLLRAWGVGPASTKSYVWGLQVSPPTVPRHSRAMPTLLFERHGRRVPRCRRYSTSQNVSSGQGRSTCTAL